jgi:hypothetical protein
MLDVKQAARNILGLGTYRALTRRFHAARALVIPHRAAKAADAARSSALIRSIVLSQRPSAIGKIGATELRAIRQFFAVRAGRRQRPKDSVITELHVVSGVFPSTGAMLMAFAQHLLTVVARMDTLVAWDRPGEVTVFERHCPNAELIAMEGLDPFYLDRPWTAGLAGKTVLVASPFVDSIERQYARRGLIWPDHPDVLPAFELQLMRLPFSAGLVGSERQDWFEALAEFTAELHGRRFDVLLVGGGAFSLPLAVTAKEMGRIGIHLGGSTQILFGIGGARWDGDPAISRFYNQYWVRPARHETPEGFRRIEAGCYW